MYCNSDKRLLNLSYWILKADTQIAKMNIYFTSSQDLNKFEHVYNVLHMFMDGSLSMYNGISPAGTLM